MSDKQALRRSLRERRRRFVAELGGRRADAEATVAAHTLPLLGGAARVALSIAAGGEVDPAALLKALALRDIATALPYAATRETAPSFRRWSPGDPLEIGPFGVLQPNADAAELRPDAIVAPLVGFDARRQRLGNGAGFYDRAFAALPDARRIGLAWSIQATDALPSDPWDVALDAIITERGLT